LIDWDTWVLLELMRIKERAEISIDRLRDDLRKLSGIGREDDGGLYRMAFTDADMAGKDWLEKQMMACGLETSRDGACNVIGRYEGLDPEAPALVIGSHIDTVPCAGVLDGALGVLSGLECLRALKQAGVAPQRPIELVAFSDEEGRFGGMFGSQAFAGRITPDTIHNAADLGGVKLSEAMEKQGLDPWQALEARRDPRTLAAYLELHIEQ
jgi:beta-ureidopropionase / N-carbamoyl-L-amino-acid hydrolase